MINNTIIISTFYRNVIHWFSYQGGHKYLVEYKLATVLWNALLGTLLGTQ